MYEKQEIEIIEKSILVSRVKKLMIDNYRLVQISCTKLNDTYQLDYTFDKDCKFLGLRIMLSCAEAKMPSISKVYFAAFLYENEMHDLFGITFEGLVLDFGGKLYRINETAPFNQKLSETEVVIKEKEKG